MIGTNEQEWRIEYYSNDFFKEFFKDSIYSEWWVVTNGDKHFTATKKEHADWLLELMEALC